MKTDNCSYNTIEEALSDLRAGKIILVTDDPDRENEGILSVRRNLPLRTTSILWHVTARD